MNRSNLKSNAAPSPLTEYHAQLRQLRSFEKRFSSDRESTVFLSVIIRTQGTRYEMLKEALLSLEKQTDQDFEIILVLHNADAKGRDAVDKLLKTLSEPLRQKIRLHPLDGGTRTAPLNYGASLMRGKYFAMLDDDDLVYDDWVSVFHTAALAHPDNMIRCYGCTQVWRTEETENGVTLLADGPITEQYCKPFHLANHLEDNQTPISCVAIPAFCYHGLGIRFDEELTTNEDWDYIMRCALTVGVHDTETITFLYRLWNNSESSRSLHAQSEWEKNRAYIAQKLDDFPIVTDRPTLLRDHRATVDALTEKWQTSAETVDRPSLFPAPYDFRSACKQIVRTVKDWIRFRRSLGSYIALIEGSAYFDADWYLRTYADVKNSGVTPARHYLLYGWRELRDPSASFSTRRYLECHLDVLSRGICPLVHYEQTEKNDSFKKDS